jgi:SAM-dependent methyltransferase
MQGTSPNADQVDYWNDSAGDKWARFQDRLDRQLEPLGRAAMDALAPKLGEHILDIGCGCGQTTLDLARRVGPSGAVTGVDISRPMLQVARNRPRPSDAGAADFMEADAQSHAFVPGAYDAVFSRFGVMFFNDPSAAFANIRKALKPGGRLAFVCWRPYAQNPWMREPMEAAEPFLPPAEPSDPLAPGPFAFADPERVRGVLAGAGFSSIAAQPVDALIGGSDLDQSVDLAFNIGPLGRALRDNPQCADQVRESVRAVMQRYETPDGLRMPAAVWIVQARNP